MFLANKSITMHGFTSWSVSVMISSLNDYRKPFLNCVGRLSLPKFTTCTTEFIHQKINALFASLIAKQTEH